MISWEYGQNPTFYVTTQDKRVKQNTYSPYVEHPHYLFTYLFKFTKDISGDVTYAYPITSYTSNTNFKPKITDRITFCEFVHNAVASSFLTHGYEANINLTAGFYKYEVYEVFFTSTSHKQQETTFLPADENNNFVATKDTNSGNITGLVETGKLLVREESGQEEIQYNKHTETQTNYIYYG